jgi:molecular chaperone GrpE
MKQQDFQEQEAAETGNSTATENAGTEQATDVQADAALEIEQLKAQVAELKDKYIRQAAEFDNFRRRTAKERLELVQTASKEVVTDLLDVLDDCDRAQAQIEKGADINQIREGIQLVFGKLRQTLTGKGLKPMDAKGAEFDADLHEAITEIEAGDAWKGKVVDEIIKGYYLNEKIIRYAKVVVGK